METGVHYPLRLDALPPGWRAGYVGDFAKEIEPGFASGEHNQSGSGVAHLRPMNIDRDGKIDLSVTKFVAAEKDRRRLTVGDVLFNNTNSPELVGKTAVVNFSGDFAFSNHMTRIRFAANVLPTFGALQMHFLWMRGYFQYNCVQHVNQASISSGTLARAVPFVWAPRDQQECIVAEIEKQFSRLDEAVANLKRVKANLKRYKATVLACAATGQLDAVQARASSTAPETPDLPASWKWVTLGEVGEIIGGLTKNPKRAVLARKLPYLRVANVYADELRLDEVETIGVSDDELPKLTLRRGDLLVVEGNGSAEQIGRVAMWDGSISPCVHQNHLIKVRLREAEPRWVLNWLLSPPGRHRIQEVASSTSGLYTLSVGKVARLPVPLPPIKDQRRMVAEVDRRLSVVREIEGETQMSLERAQVLRQRVLAGAFAPPVASL